jgi:hypothetical protein
MPIYLESMAEPDQAAPTWADADSCWYADSSSYHMREAGLVLTNPLAKTSICVEEVFRTSADTNMKAQGFQPFTLVGKQIVCVSIAE